MMKKILYLIALILPLNLFSIQNKFNYITTENGLSQGNITFIYQDSQGYIWIGTFSGLNRFDGYRCKVFNFNADDTLSLSNERVTKICEDRDHKFWVGTYGGGVSVYFPESGIFRRIQNVNANGTVYQLKIIDGINMDKDGNIWVLDEAAGLFVFDSNLKYIKSFHPNALDINALPQLSLFASIIDDDGNVWVGAGNGTLCKLPRNSEVFERFLLEERVTAADDAIRTLYIDKFGKIWIGTTSQGAYCFDPKTRNIDHYRKEDPIHPISGNTVMTFCDDWDGNLLLGLDGGGINILDRTSGNISVIRYEAGNPESVSTNAIYAIFIDRSETLWVGTYAGGVNYQGRYRYKFKNFTPNPANPNSLSYKNAKAIMQDSDGDIWIGTDGGGLNLYNPVFNTFKHYRANPDNPKWLQTDVIIHMMQDRDGDIFIGSYAHGLTIFNKQTETFKQYLPVDSDPTSIAGLHPWYIFQDSQGTIWVGMLAVGLEIFDKTTQTFIHHRSNLNDPTTLSNPNIKVIMEDNDGNVWIGTEGGGLNRYNRDHDNFTRFMYNPDDKSSLSNNDVRALRQDSKGNIWVGTSNGLNLMHNDSIITFEVITVDDGLPNNVINDILEDKDGNLWISSNHGISKFNQVNRTFRNYDMTDGLQGNEYNYTAAIVSMSGEFYFGGKNGFNVFRPDQITDNPHIPPIVLTDFQIFNKSVDKIYLRKNGKKQLVNIANVDHIKLSYKENVISFEFSALDYGNPTKNQYRYMLVGFDKSWNEVSAAKRSASYTNLKGGKYTFKVQGSNSDGLWNETGLTIKLIITPPFWQRAWFIILVALIVAYIAYRYFKGRQEQIERDKAILEEKIRQGTAELEKQKAEIALKDKAIQEKIESEKEQNWINVGMNKMSEVMSRNKDDLYQLCQAIITTTIEYLGVAQGAIYLLNDEKEGEHFLELMAAYAPDDKRLAGSRYGLEEGQLGACYTEQRIIKVNNLPDGYAYLNSGLGDAPLRNLTVIPLRLNEITIGVIELLSFDEIPEYRVNFVEKSGETLTSILTSLKANEKTRKLFEQQKMLSEEMAAQEEELRQNLEEMQATQEEMQRMRETEKTLMDQMKEQNKELVEKQNALQKEEYLFNALLSNAKELIYFKDLESRFIRMSKSMVDAFKKKDYSELIGKTDFDFFDDEHARPAFEDEQKIIKTGVPIIDQIEKEVHKDGSVKWVSTSKMALVNQHGDVVGTWGISKDVSDTLNMEQEIKQRNEELLSQEEELRQNLEEMQATQEELQRMRETEQALMDQMKEQNKALIEKQSALQKEEYLFNALLDNANEHIYFKDKESRFIRLSRSMLDLFKKKHFHELLGKSDFDFFDEEHARPAFEDEQKIIKTGKAIIDLVEKEVHKDGSISWVNTSKMPLRDNNGNIVGTWGISKDITVAKEMEDSVNRMQEKSMLSESAFETIINQLSGQVVVIDQEGNIHNANAVFAETYGIKLNQIKGKMLMNLLDKNEQNNLKKGLTQLRKKQSTEWQSETGKGKDRKTVTKRLVRVNIKESKAEYYLLLEV